MEMIPVARLILHYYYIVIFSSPILTNQTVNALKLIVYKVYFIDKCRIQK